MMYGIHMINTLRTYNVCFVQYLYNSHIITLIVIYLMYTHIKPKSELGLVVKYFIKLIKIH